jgi:MYXO-CTERM domain-containing protein
MKKLLVLFAAFLCCQAHAVATFDWSYTGQGDFYETSGHGTLTAASADLSQPQAVLSITGSFTDVTDNLYGLSPVPIVGITPVGTESHFTYDNLLGSIGPSGLLFDNGGLVFKGLREASNGFFNDVFGYVNIYSGTDALGNNLGYRVDTWLPDYAAGDFDAPVDFSIRLVSVPAVSEAPVWFMLLASLGYIALRRQRRL